MKDEEVSWRITTVIVLAFIMLVAAVPLFMTFKSTGYSSDSERFYTRLITTPIVVLGVPFTIYLLILEGRANAANRPADLPPPRLVLGMPPAVRQVIICQGIIAILCGLLDYGILSGELTRGHPDSPGFDRAAAWALSYWLVASIFSALLIWRRNRIGWIIAWTIVPGIIRTIPGLISPEMKDYFDGRYDPFSLRK